MSLSQIDRTEMYVTLSQIEMVLAQTPGGALPRTYDEHETPSAKQSKIHQLTIAKSCQSGRDREAG